MMMYMFPHVTSQILVTDSPATAIESLMEFSLRVISVIKKFLNSCSSLLLEVWKELENISVFLNSGSFVKSTGTNKMLDMEAVSVQKTRNWCPPTNLLGWLLLRKSMGCEVVSGRLAFWCTYFDIIWKEYKHFFIISKSLKLTHQPVTKEMTCFWTPRWED